MHPKGRVQSLVVDCTNSLFTINTSLITKYYSMATVDEAVEKCTTTKIHGVWDKFYDDLGEDELDYLENCLKC